jgi:RND family efflux transporter MFP subunit
MAALVALAGCKGGHEEKAALQLPVARVSVQGVAEKGIGSQLEVAGTVQAVERALIAPRVSGQIVQLPVGLGSRVRKGELLVKINVAELSAQVLQARVRLEQVRRNLAREEKLQQQEASTPETVRALRDQARIAEAALQEVTTMMEYATITAPFAGTITRKIASVGDLASPGVVLLEMENDQLLQVVAQVPERAILQVRQGDILPVTVPVAGVTVHGTVAEISLAADPVSRTARVKIDLEPGVDLRSGQFARVTLMGVEEKSLLVSERAVQPFGQMERVFLVEEAGQTAGAAKIARLRLVRTGARYDGQVEILAGLTAGDRVVVGGGERVQDGQPLEVTAESGRVSGKEQERPQGKDAPVPTVPGMETGRPQGKDAPVPSAPGMENGRP